MARVTIYVDESLKSTMEMHPALNWSRIAQDAFKRAIKTDSLWASFILDPELGPPSGTFVGQIRRVADCPGMEG